MNAIIKEKNKIKCLELEVRKKEKRKQQLLSKYKLKNNAHAIFNLTEKELEAVMKIRKIQTGFYQSGQSRGKPKIPSKLNMNSACLLTITHEEMPEEKRSIAGIYNGFK